VVSIAACVKKDGNHGASRDRKSAGNKDQRAKNTFFGKVLEEEAAISNGSASPSGEKVVQGVKKRNLYTPEKEEVQRVQVQRKRRLQLFIKRESLVPSHRVRRNR